jgi:hypothetical protein
VFWRMPIPVTMGRILIFKRFGVFLDWDLVFVAT